MVNVHVPWNPKLNTTLLWNQVTASILEHFGLPGDKYTTEITEDYMNFLFKDDREGLMCQLLVSDYV
jgi:hypothetical protein